MPIDGARAQNVRENAETLLKESPGWGTIATALHGSYTAPADVIEKLDRIAQKNGDLRDTVEKFKDDFFKLGSDDRAKLVSEMKQAAEHDPKMAPLASKAAAANEFENGGIRRWLQAFNRGEQPPMPSLSPELRNKADALDGVATRAESAAKKVPNLPGAKTLLTPLGETSDLLEKVPIVKDIPVVGAGLTALSIGTDITGEKDKSAANIATDVTKEVGGTIVAQAATTGTADLIAGAVAGTALEGSLAAGAAATGGALLVGVAAGYAATKFIEGGGKEIGAGAYDVGKGLVNGEADFAKNVGQGVVTGAKDAAHGLVKGGSELADGIASGNVSQIGHGLSDGAKGLAKGAYDVGKGVVKGVTSEAEDVGKGLVEGGKEIGKGFVDGGKNVVKGFADAGKAIGGLFSNLF